MADESTDPKEEEPPEQKSVVGAADDDQEQQQKNDGAAAPPPPANSSSSPNDEQQQPEAAEPPVKEEDDEAETAKPPAPPEPPALKKESTTTTTPGDEPDAKHEKTPRFLPEHKKPDAAPTFPEKVCYFFKISVNARTRFCTGFYVDKTCFGVNEPSVDKIAPCLRADNNHFFNFFVPSVLPLLIIYSPALVSMFLCI